jgi:hypothetical protein
VEEASTGLALLKVAQFAQLGLEAWLAALAVIVAWRLLVEGHLFNGLLSTRRGDGIEPDRLQLLLATGGGLIAYVAAGAHAIQQGADRMPDAPTELISILAASQAVYLGGKISRLRI